MDNIDNIATKTSRYKYVSFDIFDTLIFRKLYRASDLFFYMEMEMEKMGFPYLNFHDVRIKAEKEAIRKNHIADEITIDSIYNCIYFDSEERRQFAKDLELKTELMFCVPNIEMVHLLNECKKNGKKVVLISDMYLSSSNISEILKHCGILFDNLYVSSNYGIRKSSGKLFRKVLTELEINRKDIIHIGDNKMSDYYIPKLCCVLILVDSFVCYT